MGNLIYGNASSVGPYKNQVGWVDFSPVPPLSIGASQNLTCGIPGVGSISFTLTCNGPISQTQSSGDGKISGVYSGLSGSLSFGSTRDSSNTMSINVSNITVVSTNGTPITDYKILTADAETTVSEEYFEMITDGGPWIYEGIAPNGATMGDPQISGLNTNDYKQTGFSAGATSPIISSQGARNLTFKSMNNATQLFTLGLYIPGSITLTKAVDKTYAKRGDTLTYTIVLDNSTFSPATNVILTDSISGNVTFIPNSVVINGQATTKNILVPITIPDIGINSKTTITFQVVIKNDTSFNSIPNIGSVSYSSAGNSSSLTSNRVVTYVYEPLVTISKATPIVITKPGYTVTYSIFVKNSGTTIVKGVYIFDTIPEGSTLVKGSTKADGITLVDDIGTKPGVLIGDLDVNKSTTITFEVLVNTVPKGDILINDSSIFYNYINNPTVGIQSGNLFSNTVTIPVRFVSIATKKYVDKLYADRGDIIKYTLAVTNSGNFKADNVKVQDTIPYGTTFINNSLTIDGVSSSQNIDGLVLNSINGGQTITLTFNVGIN